MNSPMLQARPVAVVTALVLQLASWNFVPAYADPPPPSGGYSTSFEVLGDVGTPTTFKLADLQALPSTTLTVSFTTGQGQATHTFTDVPLWDLLQKVGIKTDPTVKNDILRKVIIATATDGYVVTTTAGEINPRFGAKQVLVAYKQDGALLDEASGGFARLVFVGDIAGGRNISWVTSIKVEGLEN